MGLVAGVIIGQIAIDVGVFSSEVVLYTAVGAIFTFIIPSYELGISIKLFRFVLLIMTGIWGEDGLFIGLFLLFTYLCSLRPLQAPYLWYARSIFPNCDASRHYPLPYDVGCTKTICSRFQTEKKIIGAVALTFFM